MTTMERFETRSDTRRAWRRLPVRIPMQCRRLARSETDVSVDVVDMSPGGVRLRCGGLITGDVVLCSVDGPDGGLRLKGLVVQNRVATSGAPFVHVAWTDVSPATMEGLGRLLDQHEDGGNGAPAPG